ncbi:MAG: hypothetical protein ACQETA_09545 [Bacteroidota bacterium]
MPFAPEKDNVDHTELVLIMKRNRNCFLLTMLLFTLGFSQLFPQAKGGTISSSQIRSIFENASGPDSRLVSGKLYLGARQGSVTGNPYYLDENWKTGYVIIDSLVFDGLLLKYDILENKLVLNTISISNSEILLCLNLEKTKRFGIDGRNFIPFPREKDSPGRWFAESVVEDTLSYLILKKKELQVDAGAVDFSYKTDENPYLLYNNELFKFNSRRTLFRLFPHLKDDLKEFIRQENLALIKKRPENLGRLTEYCNTLLNKNQ